MLTVYHLRPSRAERIAWLLEEAGLEYAVEAFDRGPDFRAPAALREIHPLGKSPLLRDGDRIITESGAIVEHLVERHAPQLAPAPGSDDRARYLEWIHWSEGSLAAFGVLDFIVCGGMVPGVEPGPITEMVAGELARSLDWVDGELAGHEFAVADAFTGADPMLTWVLEFTAMRGHVGDRAHVTAYLERMRARPAYRRAKERTA
jgi:glutathione S-transferase